MNAPPLAYLHKSSWPGVAAHLPDYAISNSKKLVKLAMSLFLFVFLFYVRYSQSVAMDLGSH